MALLLVDTDILIDVANKDTTAINRLTTESQRLTPHSVPIKED
jgi:hypothetical protein